MFFKIKVEELREAMRDNGWSEKDLKDVFGDRALLWLSGEKRIPASVLSHVKGDDIW